MKAVVLSAPGGPQNLFVADVPEPIAGASDVLIQVEAAALNRADLLQRRGLYPSPPGASSILGLECAGCILERGANTRRFARGERVMALLAGGGYAEQVVVDERLLMPAPRALSSEQAAAIPEAFLTAYEALFTLGALTPNDTVLIHAAASGVGTAAIQLAHRAGARVIASASSEQKLRAARALGADVVINYREGKLADAVLDATSGRGVNVCLDCVGGDLVATHLRCLASEARWVVFGLLGGRRAELELDRVLSQRLRILGLVMRTRSIAEKARIIRRFSRDCLAKFDTGELRPVVDRCFDLSDVAQAHAYMENNVNIGKIVLRVPNA